MTVITASQISAYAQRTGLSGAQVNIATAIAMAESGGDTNAVNPGSATDPEYSVGLWQINIRAHPEYSVSQMKDPVQNSFAMFAISGGGTNWNPWGTYTSGAYKKYLTSVAPGVLSVPLAFPTNVNTLTTGSNINLTSFVRTNPITTADATSGYAYILAYIVAGAIFVLIAKTRIGYNALYYGAVLLLILLFVTQSNFFVNALKPLTKNDTSQQQQTTLV